MKIGILNYNACNLASIYYAIYRLGYDPIILKKKEDLNNIDKLIIPGVGAAKSCLEYLKDKELFEQIEKYLKSGKPILGICLGLQIFSKNLLEHGVSRGFGLLDADVIPFTDENRFNIGWSNIEIPKNSFLYQNFSNKSFYFCHSYFIKLNNKQNEKFIHGKINHVSTVPSIIIKNNFMGVQFHPEKSQTNGIKFIENFLNWEPSFN
jgi:imidazole glycerol-phosphate synthase subunit HisH